MATMSPVYLTAEHVCVHSIGRDDEQMARLTMVLRGQASATRVLNMMRLRSLVRRNAAKKNGAGCARASPYQKAAESSRQKGGV